MLTIYRRHRKQCPCRGESEIRVHVDRDLFVRKGQRRCACGLWVDGFFQNREIRKSLGTRDWKKAQDTVDGWPVLESQPNPATEPMTIQLVGERFLKARRLNESTVYKYRLLFRQIANFADRQGLRYLKQLDLPTLDDFRSEWKDGPRSSLKKLERLRAFFGFALRRKWVSENPASDIKAPKVLQRPSSHSLARR